MSDIELVVKIPDDMIKSLEQGNFGAKYNIYDLVGCLMNGTVLPKGHGRLIDADRLTRAEIMHLWYHLPNGDIACPKVDIDHAPTIIEAERSEINVQ